MFEALIDCRRAPLKLDKSKTLWGGQRRRQQRPRKGEPPWEVVVENPTYDLTVCKGRADKLTLKIYTQGERVLRSEAVAPNAKVLRLGRSWEKFSALLARLQERLAGFLSPLETVDACFLSDGRWERLAEPAPLGRRLVAGLDLNRTRLRLVIEAVRALARKPSGFSVSDLAAKVRPWHGAGAEAYRLRQAQ